MGLADRLAPALPHLGVLAASAALIFLLSFFLFVRYDVR